MSDAAADEDSASGTVQAVTEAETTARVKQALRLVCVLLPHLAGLAYLVRISVDGRAPSIGIFPTGRLVVNPTWFARLGRREAAFVVAHELLHLALQTHRRAGSTDRRLFNVAHDYIINDMLAEALQSEVPAQGMSRPGARHLSAEILVDELRKRGDADRPSWSTPGEPMPDTAMGAALRKAAGLPAPEPLPHGESDVLPSELERTWFPDLSPAEARRAEARIEAAAAKSLSLELLRERMEGQAAGGGGDPGEEAILTQALRTLYRPPWELALQQWMEAIAPGPRTYLRPSRRGADRDDLVLAGRKREGWTLHTVLDTSGSMSGEFPRILGAIATFCEGVGVGQVRVLQCDVEVTRDELVAIEELDAFTIAGLGGSDMSPALLRLAEDPEVEAAIVLTDGYIEYPAEPMPYAVLWVLSEENDYFSPPYGQVIRLPQ